MAQYRFQFSDLRTKKLSPSALYHAAKAALHKPPGGIALYLEQDAFAVTFADELTEDEQLVLGELVAAHSGVGPDTIIDLAARRAVAEAEAATAEDNA